MHMEGYISTQISQYRWLIYKHNIFHNREWKNIPK